MTRVESCDLTDIQRSNILRSWLRLDVTLERQCSFFTVALDMAAELQAR